MKYLSLLLLLPAMFFSCTNNGTAVKLKEESDGGIYISPHDAMIVKADESTFILGLGIGETDTITIPEIKKKKKVSKKDADYHWVINGEYIVDTVSLTSILDFPKYTDAKINIDPNGIYHPKQDTIPVEKYSSVYGNNILIDSNCKHTYKVCGDNVTIKSDTIRIKGFNGYIIVKK